jgi:Rhodopirellula transposase DDE domain
MNVFSQPWIGPVDGRSAGPATTPCARLIAVSRSAAQRGQLDRPAARAGLRCARKHRAPAAQRAGVQPAGKPQTHEGADHPDRDRQFQHIAAVSAQALAAEQPLISVDTKKKELIGNYKNGGRELAPTGKPILVNTHDFIDQELGKAIPYGIYDVGQDEGWVSVGISSGTAQFAVAAIKAWWKDLGRKRYPKARTLTITADCGGSNSYRTRLWKTELQRLADQTGLAIRVMHYPPGTSKWNKIEHRLSATSRSTGAPSRSRVARP